MLDHIDGFSPSEVAAFKGMSRASAARFYGWVDRLARLLTVEVEGMDRLPKGRALLVANHTFSLDVLFPMSAVFHATGRIVWALGDHTWWRLPFVRRIAAGLGTVDGTPENVDRLLRGDQLVLVLPGGLREAMKPSELRYRLLWGHRYGFIRAALRNGAPIVPLAMVGADDIFDFVGDAFRRGARLGVPIPKPAHGLPIPHRVKVRALFGEPITLRARPEEADDMDALRHCRHEVEGALHELIEAELARRAGYAPHRC